MFSFYCTQPISHVYVSSCVYMNDIPVWFKCRVSNIRMVESPNALLKYRTTKNAGATGLAL